MWLFRIGFFLRILAFDRDVKMHKCGSFPSKFRHCGFFLRRLVELIRFSALASYCPGILKGTRCFQWNSSGEAWDLKSLYRAKGFQASASWWSNYSSV